MAPLVKIIQVVLFDETTKLYFKTNAKKGVLLRTKGGRGSPGNVKTAMVYIIDLLVTSNDLEWPLMTSKLKIENYNFMYIKWKHVTQAI